MADLFEKIKKSIDKSVTTVGVKSSTMLESTRVKGHISSLKERREQAIQTLGKNTYQMFTQGKLDPKIVEEECGQIVEIDERIKEKVKELESIQREEKEILRNSENAKEGLISCSCGQALPKDSKFCIACGNPVISSSNTCSCGAILSEDSKFCVQCGKKVDADL